jgi:hypothetical protein
MRVKVRNEGKGSEWGWGWALGMRVRMSVIIPSYYPSVIGNIETILRIYVSKMFSLIFILFGIFTIRRFNISTFLFFDVSSFRQF